MERNLSYKKVTDYLEYLANNHVDINGFVCDSPGAINDILSTVAGLPSPFLCFSNYEGKLTGNQQRTFNERTINFVIGLTNIPADDFESQKVAKNQAEEIGLEVLSRIHVDSKKNTNTWLYNNFNKDSVEYSEVELEFIDGCFGMEFQFELKTIEPLVVDPTKWLDASDFCNPNI